MHAAQCGASQCRQYLIVDAAGVSPHDVLGRRLVVGR